MNEHDPISDLKQSISQLHQKVAGQCRILARLKDLQVHIDNDIVNQKCLSCIRDREQKLIQMAQEAIIVLKEGRKAFRLRQLDGLRVKLTLGNRSSRTRPWPS